VLGIARKRAIDHLRRRRNLAIALDHLDDVVGEGGRELAERYARCHEVRDALDRLPDAQRRSWCWRTSVASPIQRSPRTWAFRLGPSKPEHSGACAASPSPSAVTSRY
jgi:hypothetical protein